VVELLSSLLSSLKVSSYNKVFSCDYLYTKMTLNEGS
jgi:hypothetical protein